MPPQPSDVIKALGGWARTIELAEHGIARSALKRAVASGRIARVREGWYVDSVARKGVTEAVRHGGVPACVTAAELHGLWVPSHEGVHVWMKAIGHRRDHDDCTCVPPLG